MHFFHKALLSLFFAFSFIPSLIYADSRVPQDHQLVIEKVVAGLNARDPKPFAQAVAVDEILDTALSDLIIEPKWTIPFRKGVKSALGSRVPNQIIELMPAWGYAKLLRVKMDGEIAKALIRIDLGESGNSYMDMHLRHMDEGKVKIVDWFIYGTGQLYTETLSQAIAVLAPTPTLLGKIYDFASDRAAQAKTVSKLLLLRKDGEHEKVARTFLTLDEELRQSRLLNIMAYESAAIVISDDFELYGQVLKNVAKYFGEDPSLGFILIDHYYLEGEYHKAVEITDRLLADFGVEDAGLIGIKANALLEMGQVQQAENLAKHAIKIEPEYEYTYVSLLNAQVAQKLFADAVDTAKTLERRFTYDLGPQTLATDDFYQAFNQSAEYRQWKQVQAQ